MEKKITIVTKDGYIETVRGLPKGYCYEIQMILEQHEMERLLKENERVVVIGPIYPKATIGQRRTKKQWKK